LSFFRFSFSEKKFANFFSENENLKNDKRG